MAGDPWAAFGGAPEAPAAPATTASATTTPPVSADDAWGAFGGAPETVQAAPPEPASAKPTGGILRNIGAGLLEGTGAAINTLMDPFGNLVGQPLTTAGAFVHDLLAPALGYNRYTDAQRADIVNDLVPQQGTRIVQSLPGANPADVPATTPAEQFTRRVTGATAAGGELGGPGAAVVGGVSAPVGAAVSQMVPPWAAPITEMATDAAAATAGSRVISPVRTVTPPGRDALVQTLQNENIPLTAGEITGSKPLLKTEQILGQAPGSAGPVAEDVQTQQQAINRAVATRAGLDSDTLDPTTLNNHMTGLGQQIDAIASNNNMPVNGQLAQTLGQIRQSLPNLKTEAAQEIRARLDQLNGMITTDANGNAVVPGSAYQSLMSDLNDSIRGASGPTQTNLLQLKNALRQQMESGMSPQDVGQWRQLNRWYANGKVIQDAMGAAGAKPAIGDISLPQLRVAINSSLGQDAYSRGFGDLNDLARAGQSVLRTPADSGSPSGIMINRLLQTVGSIGSVIGGGLGAHYQGGVEGLVGGAVAPLAAPWAVGAAMRGRIPFTNYSPGQAYLTNQLTRNVDPALVAAMTNAINAQKNPLMP